MEREKGSDEKWKAHLFLSSESFFPSFLSSIPFLFLLYPFLFPSYSFLFYFFFVLLPSFAPASCHHSCVLGLVKLMLQRGKKAWVNLFRKDEEKQHLCYPIVLLFLLSFRSETERREEREERRNEKKEREEKLVQPEIYEKKLEWEE